MTKLAKRSLFLKNKKLINVDLVINNFETHILKAVEHNKTI